MNWYTRNTLDDRGTPRGRAVMLALAGGLALAAPAAWPQEPAPAQGAVAQAQERPAAGRDRAMRSEHGRREGRGMERRLERMLDSVQATDEQKSRVSAIMKQAFSDVRPLRAQRREARAGALKLFSQPTIDRGAIEAQRVEQQKIADAVSRRMTQAFADAAEVLTAEQRSALAQRLQRSGPGHRGHGHAPRAR